MYEGKDIRSNFDHLAANFNANGYEYFMLMKICYLDLFLWKRNVGKMAQELYHIIIDLFNQFISMISGYVLFLLHIPFVK